MITVPEHHGRMEDGRTRDIGLLRHYGITALCIASRGNMYGHSLLLFSDHAHIYNILFLYYYLLSTNYIGELVSLNSAVLFGDLIFSVTWLVWFYSYTHASSRHSALK